MPVTRPDWLIAVLRLPHLQSLDAGLVGEEVGFVGSLPWQIEIGAAEMPVGGGLLVDRTSQLELANDLQRAQIEVLVDEVLDGGRRDPLRAKGLDEDRDRFADADGIGDLDLTVGRQSGGHHVLGDVARGIRTRAVDLGRVLAGKAATPVTGVAAIAVDDDLAPGHARVGARAAEDEATGGVDVNRGPLVDHLDGHDLVQHQLAQVATDALERGVLEVLGRDDDGVHPARAPVGVLDGDLGLAIGPEIGQRLVLAHLCQLPRQLMRQLDRHRHQLGRLVTGEAEHHALVAGATGVDTLGDIRRLPVDRDDDAHRVGVEAETGMVIAGLFDGVPDDVAHLDVCIGRDLADDEGEPRGDRRLAGHPAERVFRHDGVEDRVGNLVRDLVGVAFGDRLGGEEMRAALHRVPDSQPLR